MTLSRILSTLVMLLCLAGTTQFAWGFQAEPPTAAQAAPLNGQRSEKAQETEPGDNVYRHSASVKLLAGWFHLDTETAAKLFEYLNFAILAGAVLYFLLKSLPKTFRGNREQIQRQLVDARTATEQANQRLAAIEQRLGHLDQEITAISKQAEEDSVADEARIKASIETERKRIVDAVTRDIAAAGSAAQRDLKRFAAGLAVDRAAQRMVLTEDDDRSLMQEFAQSLDRQAQNRNKN